MGRKGEATPARSTDGLRRVPRLGIMGCQVCFQSELKLENSRLGHERNQRSGDVRNSVGHGHRDGTEGS